MQLLEANQRFVLTHSPANVLSHVLESCGYKAHLLVSFLADGLRQQCAVSAADRRSRVITALRLVNAKVWSGRTRSGPNLPQRHPVCVQQKPTEQAR